MTSDPPVRIEHFRRLMREAGVEEVVDEAFRLFIDSAPQGHERLVAAVHREDADAYFVRGYHYLFLGYKETAGRVLARALELNSNDQLTVDLMAMAGHSPVSAPQPIEIVPADAD